MKQDIEIITKALEKSVVFSFANLVFVDIVDHQKVNTISTLEDHDYVATIDLRVPFQGSLSLLMDKALSEKIAALMLNIEEHKDASPYADAMLAEISNTIAGRFMSALVPDDVEFGFSLPNCSKVGKRKKLLSLNGNSVMLEFSSNVGKIYCVYQPLN